MIKIRSYVIAGICFIVFSFVLTGCAANSKNQPSETTEATGIISRSFTASEGTDADNYPEEDWLEEIAYDQFLKKIWVVKDWDGWAYSHLFSFSISKIEHGLIEGRLSTGAIAFPRFYSSTYLDSPYAPNFADIKNLPKTNLYGAIINGVFECQFDDKYGNKGNVSLVFKENDEIEATIKYTSRNELLNGLPLDGTYLFRSYNLTDIGDFTKNEKNSFAVDLNSWGSVYFVSVEIWGEKSYGSKIMFPEAYLTDEQDNILYKFGSLSKTATKIMDVSIEDINRDGLKDVKIITGFLDYNTSLILPDMPYIEYIFFQMDNGLFYDSNLFDKGNGITDVNP